MPCRWTIASLMLVSLSAGAIASATEPQRETAVLARSVPADAGLFFEIGDVHAFMQARAGREFADVLAGLMPTATTRPATQPATTWQQALGLKLGIRDAQIAHLLIGGRAALVADGWNSIDDLVLLTEPADPAVLERALAGIRIPPTTAPATNPTAARDEIEVRRYKLEAEHELACDGRTVIVGRPKGRLGLYDRTVALWARGRRATLADLADFRERTGALPGDADIVFYNGPERRGTRTASALAVLWPELKSVAVGVVMNGQAVTVETSASLRAASRTQPADPPMEALMKVPASTIAAWTRPIRYVEEFRQIDAANPDGVVRVCLNVLQTGMPAGTLEDRLLQHLVGDSVIMIGQRPLMDGPEGSAGPKVMLPTAALAVETDDPDAVAGVLAQVSENLLGLINLQPSPSGPLALKQIPLGPDGPMVRSVALGRLFGEGIPLNEFFGSLEISWTVVDRWLILATHPDMVAQVAEARRGPGDPVPAGGFEQALKLVKDRKGVPQMAMIAQPDAAAKMIDSWLTYISTHHAEMTKAEWWEQLQRQRLANSVTLGFYSRPTTQPGVLVDRTMPGWPAHKLLKPGDLILGVDSRELEKANPLVSFRNLVAARADRDRVKLQLVRDGQPMPVEIQGLSGALDTQPSEPLAFLKDVADLLRVFSSANYVTWQPAADRLSVRLELELAPAVQKVSVPEIMVIAPMTAPATAPAVAAVATAPAAVAPTTAPADASTRPAQ